MYAAKRIGIFLEEMISVITLYEVLMNGTVGARYLLNTRRRAHWYLTSA